MISLISLIIFISQVICQETEPTTGNLEIYEGLVFGVGKGTVAVMAFAVLSLIICFFKDCTPTPSIMVVIAICIPIVVFGIIYALPKKSL